MNAINKEKYFARKTEILEFIENNEAKYESLTHLFMMLILTDLILEIPITDIPTSLGQILSKFGVYNNGKDPYIELLKILESYSFLEGNCCEVGAGIYPRLAELTISKIKLRQGSLTIYEPNISFTMMNNITIVKDEFKKDTNIDKIDTIYAMYPCEASITVAEKAFEEDKNLLLAFCSCDHSTEEHPKWIGKYWAEDFCMDYREKYGHEAEIINWPSTTGIDLPILIRQKRKIK